MTGKRVNVRLDAERVRKVCELRKAGITLADVVREAIDAQYNRLVASCRAPIDVEAILRDLDAKYPVPPDPPRRIIDLTDRRAAQAYIRDRLNRKRPG